MPDATEVARAFQSEKISGELYIDNEIAFGTATEIGLDLEQPVTFDGISNVHRVSILVQYDTDHPSVSVLAKQQGKSSGDTIESFDGPYDKVAFEWMLDHIEA